MKRPQDIPDCIDEVDASWENVKVFDDRIGRQFTLFKPEVVLYKKYRVAPPNEHFTSRMRTLWVQSQRGQFEKMVCEHCQTPLTVSVNVKYPQRKVVCRACYTQHLEEHG